MSIWRRTELSSLNSPMDSILPHRSGPTRPSARTSPDMLLPHPIPSSAAAAGSRYSRPCGTTAKSRCSAPTSACHATKSGPDTTWIRHHLQKLCQAPCRTPDNRSPSSASGSDAHAGWNVTAISDILAVRGQPAISDDAMVAEASYRRGNGKFRSRVPKQLLPQRDRWTRVSLSQRPSPALRSAHDRNPALYSERSH